MSDDPDGSSGGEPAPGPAGDDSRGAQVDDSRDSSADVRDASTPTAEGSAGPAVDGTTESTDGSAATGQPDADDQAPDGAPGDGVVVPTPLYRVVTVFSTLVAVVSVVAGFGVLDLATGVLSNPPGALVVRLLVAVGLPMETATANRGAIALVVGLLGLALIVGGAAFYAYGTRFRAPGMGKPKDDAHEESDNG